MINKENANSGKNYLSNITPTSLCKPPAAASHLTLSMAIIFHLSYIVDKNKPLSDVLTETEFPQH
jgi:hypothetical protein